MKRNTENMRGGKTMKKLTIGERIILAERQKEGLEKELKFCRDIASRRIDVKKHFAYLLVPVVFDNYIFDEDEEYELEQLQQTSIIQKKQFISQKRKAIRERAKKEYKTQVHKYDRVKKMIHELKVEIDEANQIINKAKRKHPISYYKAKQPASRMYSPSFNFVLMGQNIQDAFEGKKYISDIEKLKMLM